MAQPNIAPGEGIALSGGAMAKSRGDFETLRTELERQRALIEDDIQAVKGGWGGSSGPAYQIAMQRWDEKFRFVIQRLNDVIVALGGTSDRMRAMEEQNHASVQNIASQLSY